jgi:hypothetical protein
MTCNLQVEALTYNQFYYFINSAATIVSDYGKVSVQMLTSITFTILNFRITVLQDSSNDLTIFFINPKSSECYQNT